MVTLKFLKAVDYMGTPQYTIDVDEVSPDEMGVLFRASDFDSEGVFLATLVPWQNIVSMTRPLMPPPVEDQEDGPETDLPSVYPDTSLPE